MKAGQIWLLAFLTLILSACGLTTRPETDAPVTAPVVQVSGEDTPSSPLTTQQLVDLLAASGASKAAQEDLRLGLQQHDIINSLAYTGGDVTLGNKIALADLGGFERYLRQELSDNSYGQFDWSTDGCSVPYTDPNSSWNPTFTGRVDITILVMQTWRI